MKFRILAIFLALFALVTAFQNCAYVNHDSDQAQTTSAKSNGDPYYGKPYENGTGCSGSDTVRARIIYVNSSEAYLTKSECNILSPAKQLQPGDFQLQPNNPNLLQYQGLTFVASHQAALVQKIEASLNPGGNSITANFQSPTNGGNLLVCFLVYKSSGAAVASITSSQGKTFIRAIAPTATVGADAGMQSEAWYAENVPGGTASVTANFNQAVGGSTIMVCNEFSGVASAGSLDGTAISTGLTAGGGSATVGPVSTSSVDDLLVSAVWHASTNPTPGPGFTLISNFSNDIYMYGDSADPGSYVAIANNVGDWLGFVLAFKTK